MIDRFLDWVFKRFDVYKRRDLQNLPTNEEFDDPEYTNPFDL